MSFCSAHTRTIKLLYERYRKRISNYVVVVMARQKGVFIQCEVLKVIYLHLLS